MPRWSGTGKQWRNATKYCGLETDDREPSLMIVARLAAAPQISLDKLAARINQYRRDRPVRKPELRAEIESDHYADGSYVLIRQRNIGTSAPLLRNPIWL
ncbi:hypothetical protein OAS39_10620 [Pirellulales bacterium]|nr:hypothetical protein [Pirellulales bacterium]